VSKVASRDYKSVFGLAKEFHNIRTPLHIHLIFFLVIIAAFYAFLFFGDMLNLGDRAAAILFLYVIVACCISTVLMTLYSIAQQRVIGNALLARSETPAQALRNTFAHLHVVIKVAFSYSMFRFVQAIWSLKTELPIKFVIQAYKNVFQKSEQQADEAIYHKLSFWMYLLNSDLRYGLHLTLLKILAIVATIATGIYVAFTIDNSGWVLLYSLFALLLFSNFRKARLIYLRSLHASLLVSSFHAVVHKIHTEQTMYVHEGMYAGDLRLVQVLDRPIHPVSTVQELGTSMNHDEPDKAPVSVSSQDPRVLYVRKNLQQGFPEPIIRQALIDAGNAANVADGIISLAKSL